jgi:hypothetical protein
MPALPRSVTPFLAAHRDNASIDIHGLRASRPTTTGATWAAAAAAPTATVRRVVRRVTPAQLNGVNGRPIRASADDTSEWSSVTCPLHNSAAPARTVATLPYTSRSPVRYVVGDHTCAFSRGYRSHLPLILMQPNDRTIRILQNRPGLSAF